MKNVLITGAAGFLGSHLAQHHLDAGDRVWGVDNFCSSDENSAHLKRLRAFETFTLIEHDICDDRKDWDPRVELDLVMNFACPASPAQYQAMPVLTMMTCTVGTANVLDLAQESGAVMVHASTSEVYGEPLRSPQDEELRSHVNPYGPRACYDAGKMAAEALCYDYLHTYLFDVRVVRIHNTYGPGMDPNDGRVVSNFIRQALQGEKLTIYGDGWQTRSFCYVDDMVRGIVAMGALEGNPSTPINLGNPSTFTIRELAHRVLYHKENPHHPPTNWACLAKGLDRWDGIIECHPLPIDDPTHRCPDISKARKLLGWEPKVELAEGLRETIEHFRRILR